MGRWNGMGEKQIPPLHYGMEMQKKGGMGMQDGLIASLKCVSITGKMRGFFAALRMTDGMGMQKAKRHCGTPSGRI